MTKTSSEQAASVAAWFHERIPEGWFTAPPEVEVDGEEILVVGRLALPDGAGAEGGEAAACAERIAEFRETTRDDRIRIARQAESLYQRAVSWGAECGDLRRLFTTASVPVMTRLRMPERSVLDTLIESGVARSRSEALAWCVRLVSTHEGEWLADLQDALTHVRKVRAEGPRAV
jgi:hypothetical protein